MNVDNTVRRGSEHDLGATFDKTIPVIGKAVNNIASVVNYKHNRGVAIGTGVGAIAAIIALVALAIFFPPLGLGFFIATGIAGSAILALTITSIVHAAKAAKANSAMQDLTKTLVGS